MALLKTSSKSTLVVAAMLLLMALVATAVSSSEGGHQEEAEDRAVCAKLKGGCTENMCGGLCAAIGSNGIAACKVESNVSYCCCVPKPSAHIAGVVH